jgi:hypothetical protein
MHNVPHTEEAKEKISLANKGKRFSIKTEFKRGKGARWKGGRRESSSGYIHIHSPKHPYRHKNNYYPEHRLVMEKELGRYLEKDEVVHHKDHNKKNNDISNLELLTKSTHGKLHFMERKEKGIRYLSRLNRFITFNGETKILTDWASEFGLTFAALKNRLDRGWTIERALKTKMRKYVK